MALITAPSQRSTQSSIWNLQLPAETVSETNTSPRGTHQTTRRQKETGLCFPHTGDGNCPRLLLIERWVANEAGHTALSLETQRHRSTPTSHPLSPEVERENVKKIENFAWVGMNVGVGSHPSRPSAGCSYRLSGHIRVCRRVCRPPGTVWHPLQTCLTIFYFSSVFFCYTTD